MESTVNLVGNFPGGDAPNLQRVPFDEAPTTSFHVLVAVAAAGGQFSDGYILGTIGIALSLSRETLHLNATWMGLLGGASLAGLFVGSLLLGPLADRFGRRPLLIPTMAAFTVISMLQFFVTSPWQLLVLRLLLGLALGVDYVVCCTVVAEFAPMRTRARLLSLLVLVWTLGYTTAFIVGTLLSSEAQNAWRWILLSSAAPSAIVFVLRLFIPETPAWLVQHGKAGKARQIVTRYIGSSIDLPMVQSSDTRSLLASWRELLGPKYRRRAVVGAVMYTAQVIPYFALGTFIPAVFEALGIRSNYLGGAIFNVFMLLGTAFGLWLIDKITRRQFIISAFYISAVTLLALVLVNAGAVYTVTLSAFFAFVLAASTNLDFAYLPELFPTRLRAVGVGFGTAASRVGSAFSTFMLPLCMEALGIRVALGLCVGVLLVGGVVCHAFAPETQGQPIEVEL